jgi:hypothetical protein
MAASRTGTWAPRINAIIKMLLGICLLTSEVTGSLASGGLEPRRRTMVLPWRVVSHFCLGYFSMSSSKWWGGGYIVKLE